MRVLLEPPTVTRELSVSLLRFFIAATTPGLNIEVGGLNFDHTQRAMAAELYLSRRRGSLKCSAFNSSARLRTPSLKDSKPFGGNF
jgi:hypothetical protein